MDMAGQDDYAASESLMDTALAPEDGAFDEEEPVHWLLSGTLRVVSGALVAEQSTLETTVVGTESTELCVDNVAVANSVVVDELPEPELEGGWQITISENTESCLTEFGVFGADDSFFLGVGPLHPEIRAVMAAEPDLADVSVDTIHSVFASFEEDGPLWVFGVAGTPADFSGEIEATIPGEVSDGLWSFRALYGFPFAGN